MDNVWDDSVAVAGSLKPMHLLENSFYELSSVVTSSMKVLDVE